MGLCEVCNSEKVKLRVVSLFLVMLDVFLNDFGCHFIAYSANKVAVFPEFSTPQLFLDFGMFLKNSTRAETFEPSHNLTN